MLRDVIRPLLGQFFNNRSFREARAIIDRKYFGNEILEFESDDIRVRFVKDRDDILVDVGPKSEPAEWFLLDNVLEIMGHVPHELLGNKGMRLAELAQALTDSYFQISSILSQQHIVDTKNKLLELQKAKMARFFVPEKP